jgi:hypothetical protein
MRDSDSGAEKLSETRPSRKRWHMKGVVVVVVVVMVMKNGRREKR